MHENQFSGSLPNILGSAPRLTDLRLASNNLIGFIPESIYNLSRLFRLDISNNRLVGTISERLTTMTSLEVFDISNNRFFGEILYEVPIPNLREVQLQFNQLSGFVPICGIDLLKADCLPESNPPQQCPCCTACCDRDLMVCTDGEV